MRTKNVLTLNWRRPIPNEDPDVAQLMALCTALASEVTVLRERLDTHERLAAKAGLFGPEDVDAYEPDAPANSRRDKIRQGQIRRIFRPLKDAAEREARAAEADLDGAVNKAAKSVTTPAFAD